MLRRLAAAMLLLSLAACNGTEPEAGSSGRERVVETLVRAIEAGDCDQVKEAVVAPSEIDCGLIADSAGTLAEEGIDLDEITYEAGRISGDSSTVMVTWRTDMSPEPTDVQRVDGKWLVVFDSAA